MFFQHTEKKNLNFFTGAFVVSRTQFSVFFHVHEFEFHGQNLMKNFTGTFLFSRALFNVFSGFFTGTCFFFHGKKKHCVIVGFHRFFDQNLYILAFFYIKSGQLSTAKQMFHFHRKIKRNVYIWQFLARKRGRCGKRNLSILLSKICRCAVVSFHRFLPKPLHFDFFFTL